MAYEYDLAVSTGAGLTLTASVVDTAGSALGVQPAYTIVVHGNGFYTYHTSAMAAGTRGTVKILNGSTIVAIGVVTPRETENADVLTSTRMATFTYTAPLDAAGIRTAVGLGTANLDTQLSGITAGAGLTTAQEAKLDKAVELLQT